MNWPEPELNLLRNIYKSNTSDFIVAEFQKHGFNRTWRNIKYNAKKLGLIKDKDTSRADLWLPEENELLKKIYENNTQNFILSHFPKRSWKSIREHAIRLNLHRSKTIISQDRVKATKSGLIKKYNVDCSFLIPATIEKIKQRNIEKYGTDHPLKSKKIRDKINASIRERHGVENVFQLESVKQKIKKTNILKYGVENPQQNKDVHERTKKTNLKKYGVENLFQKREQIKATMLRKWGKENPLQVPEIKQKVIKTNMERYGFPVPNQCDRIRKKLSRSLQKSEVKRKKHLRFKERKNFSQSSEEIMFYNYLKQIDPDMEHHKLHPALNHDIDFFSPKYNLWIQFDGSYWHGKVKITNKVTPQSINIHRTIKRDEIQNQIILNLIRFDSVEVIKKIKNNTIISFIENKINKKIEELKTQPDPVCFQHTKKMEHYSEDIKNLSFNPNDLKASIFELSQEHLSSEIIEFIEKYEWLGTIGNPPKWCFTARYKNVLAGVILINEPVAYSHILGKDTSIYEALIQRGATASWTPKNLGSRLIMYACRWMVNNTSKRAFIGYADPCAGERGILYRACNFDYLGDKFGNKFIYRHCSISRTFTTQHLRRTSSFKTWCRNNSIEIQKEWFKDNGFKNLNAIPTEIKNRWVDWIKNILKDSVKFQIDKKMKYVLILGKNKKERNILEKLKTYTPLPYPYSINTSLKSIPTTSLNSTRRSRKTNKKIQFIIDNYKKISRAEIAKELNETLRWTKRQIRTLRKNKIIS